MIETLNTEAVDNALRTMIAPGGRVRGVGFGARDHRGTLERIAHDYVDEEVAAEVESVGYDAIVAIGYLHHIAGEEVYEEWVDRFASSLKPGGLLVVIDREPPDEVPDADGFVPRGYLPVLNHPTFANMQVMAGDFGGHWCAGFWKRDCKGITIPADSVLGPEGSIIGPEAFTVERIGDRLVLASATPPCIAIERELMERARADGYLNRVGDMIHLRFDNARPIYRIIGWAGRGAVAVCERVEAA